MTMAMATTTRRRPGGIHAVFIAITLTVIALVLPISDAWTSPSTLTATPLGKIKYHPSSAATTTQRRRQPLPSSSSSWSWSSPSTEMPASLCWQIKSCYQRRSLATRFAVVDGSSDNILTDGQVGSATGQQRKDRLQFSPARDIRVERYARLPVWPVWAGVILFVVGFVAGPERASKLEHYLGGRVCPMILQQDEQQQQQQQRDVVQNQSSLTVEDLAVTGGGNPASMESNSITSTGDADTRTTTSPFLLLVHHNHHFWKWDSLFRTLSKSVLPEGFPAHPHRGFTTLTYFLPDTGGGFVHRDSLGVKQSYGSTPKKKNFVKGLLSNGSEYDSKYEHIAQWLFTGAGLLHEEMFDLGNSNAKENKQQESSNNSRHELYQLWVNVPAQHKLDPPRVDLLKRGDDIPIVSTEVRSRTYTSTTKGNSPFSYYYSTQTNVAVIAGSYFDFESKTTKTSSAPTLSDMNILHTTLKSSKKRRSTSSTKREEEEEEAGSSTLSHRIYFDNVEGDWKVEEIKTNTKSSKTDDSDGSDDDEEDEIIPGYTYEIPPNFDTVMVYVRRGSCEMTTVATSRDSAGQTKDVKQTQTVTIHSTAFIEKSILNSQSSRLVGEKIVIRPKRLDETVDLFILAGQPLYETYSQTVMGGGSAGSLSTSNTLEPVAMQGSMVMNYPQEVESAYRDYQLGKMGRPWDHELTDEEWREHVRSFPCRYNYINQRRERIPDYY